MNCPFNQANSSLPPGASTLSLFASLLKGFYFLRQAVHLVPLHHPLLLPSVHLSLHVPSLWLLRWVLFLASHSLHASQHRAEMYLVDAFKQSASEYHECIQI